MEQLDAIRRAVGLETGPLPFSQCRAKIPGTPKAEEHFAESLLFNGLIIFCILIDSAVVGVEIDNSVGDSIEDRPVYWLVDVFFGLVFITEMFCRLHQQSWEYFADAWNIFDYICVSMGVTSLVQPTSGSGTKDVVNLRVVKALKGFRVLRLLRVVRHIGGLKMVEGLWLLVAGFLNSVKTLFWVGIFLLLMIYSFGVALVTLSDDEELFATWEHAEIYVGSVTKAMWTVLQVCTFDDWSEIARHLFKVTPLAGGLLIAAIVVITFGTLNVLLAVMVEHIRDCMDERNKRMARKLEESDNFLLEMIAKQLDRITKGDQDLVEYKDFRKLLKTSNFQRLIKPLSVQTAEADEIFKLFDLDDGGGVASQVFISGLRRRKGCASGQDLVKTICFAQRECSRARKYADRVRRLSDFSDTMQLRLNSMGTGLSAEIKQRQAADKHAAEVRERAVQVEAIVRKMDHNGRVFFPSLPSGS